MMYQDICNHLNHTTDFQKVDQHAGGKWLIQDTKRRKDNQLQSLNTLQNIQVE